MGHHQPTNPHSRSPLRKETARHKNDESRRGKDLPPHVTRECVCESLPQPTRALNASKQANTRHKKKQQVKKTECLMHTIAHPETWMRHLLPFTPPQTRRTKGRIAIQTPQVMADCPRSMDEAPLGEKSEANKKTKKPSRLFSHPHQPRPTGELMLLLNSATVTTAQLFSLYHFSHSQEMLGGD